VQAKIRGALAAKNDLAHLKLQQCDVSQGNRGRGGREQQLRRLVAEQAGT